MANDEGDIFLSAARDWKRLQLVLETGRPKYQTMHVPKRIFGCMSVIIRTCLIVQGRTVILLCVRGTSGACCPSWQKLPGAFVTVVQYTTLHLTGNLRDMRSVLNRVLNFYSASLGRSEEDIRQDDLLAGTQFNRNLFSYTVFTSNLFLSSSTSGFQKFVYPFSS